MLSPLGTLVRRRRRPNIIGFRFFHDDPVR
jgi:hypothetical protein